MKNGRGNERRRGGEGKREDEEWGGGEWRGQGRVKMVEFQEERTSAG